MHRFVKRVFQSFGPGSATPPSARPAGEGLEDRFLLTGFYPGAMTLNPSILQLYFRHPDLSGKTLTLADAGGNAVATLHITAEAADGHFSGTLDNSAWHFHNADGTAGLPVQGYVGPDFWSPILGGGSSGPSISFQGSASGTATMPILPGYSRTVADTESVNFQGGLYQGAQGLGMGGSFDETDAYPLFPGYTATARTHTNYISGLLT
jgi:hypothetical protein